MARTPRYLDDLLTDLDSSSWREAAPEAPATAPDYFGTPDPWPTTAPVRSPHGPHRPQWRRWWWLVVGVLVVLLVVGMAVLITGRRGSAAPSVEQTAVSQPTPTAAEPSPTVSAEPSSTEPTPTATPTPSATATAKPSAKATAAPRRLTALQAVKKLAVGGERGWNTYDRDAFGEPWADTDRNGCDQRNDVLNRDLDRVVHRSGTGGCIVDRGTFHDPYSGTTMRFKRGWGTSIRVQIDHVVPLADAWRTGANRWSAAKREKFANDLLNLLASEGSLNQQKSDQDASEWLPPNKSFRCAYVARQVSVKKKYGLRVTRSERGAMVRVLSHCPAQPLLQGNR